MKFRRKSQPDEPVEQTGSATDSGDTGPGDPGPGDIGADTSRHPVDAEDVDQPESWVDLGGLLVRPQEARELRLQVDEATHQVQALTLVGPDGAAELRAFSAPRNGELWEEARRSVAADVARRGGTATEQQGPFGTELVCRTPVSDEQGRAGQQPSRVLGIEGSRWMLMVTLFGRPAVETVPEWEDFSGIAVRRGETAMPPGDALPLVLPDEARRTGPLAT